MRRARVVLPSAMFLFLVGCGDVTAERRPEPGGSPSAPAGAEWSRQPVAGTPAVDFPSVLAADDEAGVLVAFFSDEGVLQSHASPDGRALVEGEPLETGVTAFGLGGATAFDGGWYALGSGGLDGDDLLAEPIGFRSADGLSWNRVEVSGIGGQVDIEDVVTIDGTLVALGQHRPPEDAYEGFRAAVWTSTDGVTWTEVALPGAADRESSASDLAVAGDRVLASGRSGNGAVLWASDDVGATWTVVDVPALADAYSVGGVAAVDDVVVATVAGGALRSTDGGRTWQRATAPPPGGSEDDDFPSPVWSGGGRFFATTSVFREAFGEPEVCYADIELCRQDTAVSLYTSDDGDTWSRVDTSGIGAGEDGEVDQVVGTAGGGVVVLQGYTSDGPAVSTWPAAVALPTEPEPVVAEVDLVDVPRGGPEPGVRYHAPLYIHCGMDFLYLGEQPWRRTDGGAGAETGAGEEPPTDWPVAQETIFGYATLVGRDELEYSLGDGEVIATYAPSRTGSGCD